MFDIASKSTVPPISFVQENGSEEDNMYSLNHRKILRQVWNEEDILILIKLWIEVEGWFRYLVFLFNLLSGFTCASFIFCINYDQIRQFYTIG